MTYNNDFNETAEEKATETPKTSVPYIVYESSLARAERHIKRLWIALVIAIIVIFATNIAWLYYESQFETVSYSQDGEGLNNINTGTQGDLYGADSKNQEEEIGQS